MCACCNFSWSSIMANKWVWAFVSVCVSQLGSILTKSKQFLSQELPVLYSMCVMVLPVCLCMSASLCANFLCASWSVTYQGFVLDLLADELVFTQGVAGLSSDSVDGPLFHLLFDGAVQHEQRLSSTLLRAHMQTDKPTDSHMREHHSINTKKSIDWKHLQSTYCKYLITCNHTFNLETLLITYTDLYVYV